MSNQDPEEAIRTYLRWLHDPQAFVDLDRIRELEERAERAADPIDRLRALNDLQQVNAVDEKAIRAAFVRHARAWAEENGISAEAFRQMSVPAADLRAAGLTGGAGRRSARPAKAPGEASKRRSRVDSVTIVAHVPDSGPFTVRSVAQASGASVGAVRKVVQDLVERGEVREAGTAREPGSRGRAALAYART